MSQNRMQMLRQNLHKQRRKQQLHRRLSQKRKILSEQLVQKQKQTFVTILPNITDQNYPQYRSIISDYARSDQYSFQLIPVLHICYDYLTFNSSDISSWEIITSLSYYQDFQVPKMQQFALKICNFIEQRPDLGCQLLLNISKLSKCSYLCFQLINCKIIQIVQTILRKSEQQYCLLSEKDNNNQNYKKQQLETQILYFLLSLSYLFTLKPMLDRRQLQDICHILNNEIKTVKTLKQFNSQAKFRLIANVIQDFSQQQSIHQLLVRQFQETISNEFATYQFQSLKFVDCCIRSHTLITQSMLKNTFNSLKSNNVKCKLLGLRVLQQILKVKSDIQQMEIEQKGQQSGFIIQNINQLPSFEDFLSKFRPTQKAINYKSQQIERKNRLVLYSIIFNEQYEHQFKVLLEIIQSSSKQQVKVQVIKLIRNLITCLIKEIQCYSPQKCMQFQRNLFVPQDLDQYLDLSIHQDHLYLILRQCLQSKNTQMIKLSLQIIQAILCYQIQQTYSEQLQNNNQEDTERIIVLLKQNNIISIIQNHELDNQNIQIKNIASSVLEMVCQCQEQI